MLVAPSAAAISPACKLIVPFATRLLPPSHNVGLVVVALPLASPILTLPSDVTFKFPPTILRIPSDACPTYTVFAVTSPEEMFTVPTPQL